MAQLREQATVLEDEIVTPRRRLQDAPKRVRTLEEKLLETKGQLAQAVSQNEKLTFTLQQAREHIATLREEVEKLTQPPSAYGTYLAGNEDGTVDVFSWGRKVRVSLPPEPTAEDLKRGDEVGLNESLNVVLARGAARSGESTTRSRPSPTPWRCRSSTGSCSAGTGCRLPRESCCTALRAAARRSSPRPSPTRWPRRSPNSPAIVRRGATS